MPGITQSQMITLLNTTISNFMKGKHVGTQQLQQYAGVEKFILSGKSGNSLDGHTFEWVVQLRKNSGSFRGVDFHEAWSAVEGPAPVRASVKVVKYEGKGIVVDARERAMNGGPGQIVNMLNTKKDAFFEEVYSTLERDIFGIPQAPNDGKRLTSLYQWARPSMNSSGTFVADTIGGFNGQYIRYANGATAQSTLAGIDAADLNNERWRNWVFTHGGTLTLDVCRAIRRANNYTNFKAFPKKIGETVMGSVSIFMNQAFHEAYLDLINAGPDDRRVGANKADIFPFQESTVAGVNIIRAPQLDLDATAPIFGVRHDKCYIARMPGFWFRESGFREKPDAHNSLYAPIDVCGELICESPREAVWVGHGSF